MDAVTPLNFSDWATKWYEEGRKVENQRSLDIMDLVTIFQILGFSITLKDTHDPVDIFPLSSGEKGLKVVASCSHSGLRIALESPITCNCTDNMIKTMTYSNNPEEENSAKLCFLNISPRKQEIVKSILTNLLEMMHPCTKNQEQNENIIGKGDFVTEIPQIKIISPSTYSEKYRSLDSLTPKSEEPVLVTRSSSLNLSKTPPNTSSPVPNTAIFVQEGYSKLMCVQKLVQDVIEMFENNKQVPKFHSDFSNINVHSLTDSEKSLEKKLDAKKIVKSVCHPAARSASSSSIQTKPSTTMARRLSDSKPSIKPPSTSTKSQKYAHVKSTIPKANTFKK